MPYSFDRSKRAKFILSTIKLTPLDSSVMDSQEETSLQSFLYEEGDLI